MNTNSSNRAHTSSQHIEGENENPSPNEHILVTRVQQASNEAPTTSSSAAAPRPSVIVSVSQAHLTTRSNIAETSSSQLPAARFEPVVEPNEASERALTTRPTGMPSNSTQMPWRAWNVEQTQSAAPSYPPQSSAIASPENMPTTSTQAPWRGWDVEQTQTARSNRTPYSRPASTQRKSAMPVMPTGSNVNPTRSEPPKLNLPSTLSSMLAPNSVPPASSTTQRLHFEPTPAPIAGPSNLEAQISVGGLRVKQRGNWTGLSYTEDIKRRALTLFNEGMAPSGVARQLAREFPNEAQTPGTSAIQKWIRAARIEREERESQAEGSAQQENEMQQESKEQSKDEEQPENRG